MKQEGRKDDALKLRWDLVPWRALEQVVRVLTQGAAKYDDWNWPKVERARERYFAALQRHVAAWRAGEQLDDEWRLPHLAHAACCLLFLLALDLGDTSFTGEKAPEEKK